MHDGPADTASGSAQSAVRPGLTDDAGRPYRHGAWVEISRLADTNPDLERLADRLSVLLASERPGLYERVPGPEVALVGAILGSMVVWVWLSNLGYPAGTVWGWTLGLGVPAVAAATYFVRRSPRVDRLRVAVLVAEAIVEDGLCASCAYSLRGIPASGGFLQCPECGASWSAGRVRRFAAVAPDGRERTLRRASTLYLDRSARGWERRRLSDDRGSPRAVIALRRAAALSKSAPPGVQTRLRGVIRGLRPRGRLKRLGLLMLIAPGGLVIVGLLWAGWRSGALFTFHVQQLFHLAWLVGWPLMIVAILRSDVGRKPERVRDEFLASGLCPACAGDLRDLSPQADGCIECRTCSAAWRSRAPG